MIFLSEKNHSIMPTATELKALGNEAFSKGEYKKSAKIYRDAIAIDPKNPVLYSNRAQAFLKLEDYDRALKDTIAGLQLTTDLKLQTKLLFRKGMALKNMGDPKNANAAFSKVLELDPSNTAAKLELSQLSQSRKKAKLKESSPVSSSINVPIKDVDVLSPKFQSALNKQQPSSSVKTPTTSTANADIKPSSTTNPTTSDEPFAHRLTMHFLSALKSIPDSRKSSAYKYVLNIDPSEYQQLFSRSGVDAPFMEFFMDALASESETDKSVLHLAIDSLETLSKFKRYHLALDFCNKQTLNKIMNQINNPELLLKYKKVMQI